MARPRRGATIWLIIACIFVVVLIGLGFIYIQRIMSGGMEVVNAVDAGTLNVAKHALVNPTVDVVAENCPAFVGLGENDSNLINLVTYNRAVALAIMVAANAEEEDTDEARTHARDVFNQLKRLQAALNRKFQDDPTMGGAFMNCAEPNVPRMLGSHSNMQERASIESGYFQVGGASNIYFVDNQLPPTRDMTQFLVDDTSSGRAPGGHKWLAGYKPVSIGAGTFYATPVFPGKTPHLISEKDFGNVSSVAGVPDPAQAVLPNCFRKGGGAISEPANSNVESQAHAVVGALNRQYPARFPYGYVRIVNPAGLNRGYRGSLLTDGANDLFNKELFAPNKISQSNNAVFSTDVRQLAAWVAYNNSTGSDEWGRDPALDPRNNGFNMANMRFGSGRNQQATLDQLLEVTAIDCTCSNGMYDRTSNSSCEDRNKVNTWAGNFGRSSRFVNFQGERGFTSIEWLKVRCLEERGRIGNTFGTLLPPPPTTGLMLFQHGAPYPVPQFPAEFGQLGTPWQLMEQVGQCATTANGSAFSRILRRCRQIKPDCTYEEVKAVLNSRTLPLGSTLYIYRNDAGRLVMDAQGPRHKTDVAPDGAGDVANCLVSYDFEGTTVNTGKHTGTADADFEDRPWSQARCSQASDSCKWTDSSGYENLLGVLEFENKVLGTCEFGAPN